MAHFLSIPDALEHIRQGKFLILVDDESRENEGDLFIPAQKITPQALTFMLRHACGTLCLPLTGAQLDQLELPLQVPANSDNPRLPAFAVSIDAVGMADGGGSAKDIARTIQVAADPAATPQQLIRPGHISPLRARAGGVLERPGHTEASVDLARLAGLWPAGVIQMMIDEEGEMRRLDSLAAFGAEHGIPLARIDDLIAYRQAEGA